MHSFKTTIWAGTLSFVLLFLCTTPATSAEPESLIFLHYWTGPLSGGINEMAETFNKANPRHKVRATGFEHESFKVGINVMLAGGAPPDLFSYWAGAKVMALVNKGYLTPIDKAWDKAGLSNVFTPAVSQACTYRGHKYALPLTQHYVAFFYNKEIFDLHGLKPPANWEEFIALCDRLKQKGITPIAMGSREKWPAQFWFDYLLLRTAGPGFRQQLMAGAASYDDPAVKKVFTLWKTMLDAGYFNESANHMDWSEASRLVHSGQAAMTLMGTWAIGLFDGQLGWKQERDYDFFSFPVMDPNIPLTALGPIDVIVVPREGRAKNVNSVLTYFSAPGPQMEMSRGSGALAPSQAIPDSFYSPLQSRILSEIRETPHWAFNYDLATPPKMAELGLEAFKEFIDNPGSYKRILERLDSQSRQHFASTNNN